MLTNSFGNCSHLRPGGFKHQTPSVWKGYGFGEVLVLVDLAWVIFDIISDDAGYCFQQVTVSNSESCKIVAVDVDFSDNFSTRMDWDHNFGFGLDRTGEVTRIEAYIVDDDRLARRNSGTADALGYRNADVGRRITDVGTYD